VSAAWSLLARAGTIATDGRRGTRVVTTGSGPARYRKALESRTFFDIDLSTGVPDPALLPSIRSALRRLSPSVGPGSYLDTPVLPPLAELLQDSWPCDVERLTVVDGAMDALQQIAAATLRYGDTVIVEDPTFPPLLDLLDSVGATVRGVPVDINGMRPERLAEALSWNTRAVFLQPRGHNPTGATLTSGRVGELARVLANSDALIVEDDATGDIATTAPISLGRRLPNRVLHVRSFSKSHGPDLRLAAVGGPAELLDPIVERRLLGQGWTSRLLQSLLLELLTDPVTTARVAAAAGEYARRRDLLLSCLQDEGLDVAAPDGINVWLPVADEAAALVRLGSRGIGVAAGGPFAVQAGGTPHVRVTAGLIADHHQDIARELDAAAAAGGWHGPR
jgi:DNA-binding transcriptional MocR family regulator